MNATRPKSKPGKKRNKAKARVRKAELLKALDETVKSARAGKTVKAAPKPATKASARPKADTKAKKEVKEPTSKEEIKAE